MIDQNIKSSASFKVEDVFRITGRGTVLTGSVLSGVVTTGDTLINPRGTKITIKGIETMGGRQNIPIGLLVGDIPKGAFIIGEIWNTV